MDIKSLYKWEAELPNGDLLTQGEDLSRCSRVSFLPQVALLRQHDLIGLPFIRRFCRSINKVSLGNNRMIPGKLKWQTDSEIIETSESLVDVLKVGDLIRKRHDGEEWWPVALVSESYVLLTKPYTGRTKEIESRLYMPPAQSEYLHCVVGKGFRFYLKSSTGGVLFAPEYYELYI